MKPEKSPQSPTRFYSLKELCAAYGVSHVTMRKYIAKVPGVVRKKNERKAYYSPKQVGFIFEHLGNPFT